MQDFGRQSVKPTVVWKSQGNDSGPNKTAQQLNFHGLTEGQLSAAAEECVATLTMTDLARDMRIQAAINVGNIASTRFGTKQVLAHGAIPPLLQMLKKVSLGLRLWSSNTATWCL